MRIVKLHSRPLSAIKESRLQLLSKKLLITCIALLALPLLGYCQPSYSASSPQTFTVCENSGVHNINLLLKINDPDIGNTIIWSVNYSPLNGTLAGFPVSGLSNGSILSVPTPVSYTPNTGFSGIDSFQIEVADAFGGSDFMTVIVTVNPPPVVAPITGPNTECIGSTITLNDDTTGGIWGATNSNATQSGGVVTGVTPGNDTITYSVTGPCGVTTVTTNVLVTLLPDAGVISGPSTSVCPGATITLTSTVPGGTWSALNPNAMAGSATGIITGVTSGSDIIYYSLTLACGTGVSSIPITILAMPIAGTISGPSYVCVGSNITMTDPIGGGLWFMQNAYATVGISSGIIHGVTAGVDTVFYRVGNACGISTTQQTVTVNPLPYAGVISGPTSVCVGSTITLTDLPGGGAWLITNPALASISSSGVLTGLSAGVDVATYPVTNICGTAIASYSVTINPLPNAGTITGTDSVCVGDSVLLNDATALGAGTWSVYNSKASIAATTASSHYLNGLIAGLDTVKYTYINMCGTATTTLNVIVKPLPFAGVINGPTTVCVHAVDTLVDSTTGGVWSASTANTSVSPSGVYDALVSGVTAGTNIISYTYTNFCGVAYAVHRDTILALPDSGIISGPVSVCKGATITLVDTASGGVWTSSSSNASVSGGTVSGVSGGVATISYAVTNSCRTSVVTYNVAIHTVPASNPILGDTAICADSILYLADSTPGGVWTVSNPLVLIDADGGISGVTQDSWDTVTYTVTNECGFTTETFTLHVLPNAVCWHTYVNPLTNNTEDYNIYPNPASDELVVKVENGTYTSFIITNSVGQVIMKQPLHGNETDINVQSLTPGLYNITLKGEINLVTRKFIKD